MNPIKRMRVTVDGKTYEVSVELLPDTPEALPASAPVPVPMPAPAMASARPSSPAPAPAHPDPVAPPGSLVSPLSGTIGQIHVSEGQVLAPGQLVLMLEAMKMNTPITAPSGGTVKAILVREGETVAEGRALVALG